MLVYWRSFDEFKLALRFRFVRNRRPFFGSHSHTLSFPVQSISYVRNEPQIRWHNYYVLFRVRMYSLSCYSATTVHLCVWLLAKWSTKPQWKIIFFLFRRSNLHSRFHQSRNLPQSRIRSKEDSREHKRSNVWRSTWFG